MAEVRFASSIARHVEAPSINVSGATLAEVFAQVFRKYPQLKGYVLDDQGVVRKHITVFINDRTIRDRQGLSDAVCRDDKVHVFQALSGG